MDREEPLHFSLDTLLRERYKRFSRSFNLFITTGFVILGLPARRLLEDREIRKLTKTLESAFARMTKWERKGILWTEINL
jgi:hypothetical protein